MYLYLKDNIIQAQLNKPTHNLPYALWPRHIDPGLRTSGKNLPRKQEIRRRSAARRQFMRRALHWLIILSKTINWIPPEASSLA